MIGDPHDPLALDGEHPDAKHALDAYLADEISLEECERQIDKALCVGEYGQNIDEPIAHRETEERRVQDERTARARLQKLIDADLAPPQTSR